MHHPRLTRSVAGRRFLLREKDRAADREGRSESVSQSVSFTASNWTSTLADICCLGRTNIEIR